MPSLLETVTALLRQGDNLNRLGAMLDIDADRASVLVDLATPVVIAGLANRAAEPGGADIVVRLLDGVDASIVDNPLVFVERGDAIIGDGLLQSIFAGEHLALTAELAEWADAPEPMIGRLLPGILALAIGVLGRRRAISEVDEAGVLTLLDEEKSSLPSFRPADVGDTGVGGVDNGIDQDRVPAMAGAAAAVGALGAAGTTSGPAGSVTRLAGSDAELDAGSTGRPPIGHGDVDGVVPAEPAVDGASGRSRTIGDRPSGSDDRNGPGLLWLVVGGLAAVVLLAWTLSQLVGGGSDTTGDRVGAITETTVEPPDRETDNSAADSADGTNGVAEEEGDGADGAAGKDDDDPQTDGSGDDASAAEAQEPVTINEELSLDPITFEVRSAMITADGLAVLDEAAEYLKADPEVTVEIAGHTDSDGGAADNIRLSTDRADVVKAYLESQGIDGARMTSVGYGEDDPIASNDTEAGKARNRRIEFIIQ